MDISPWGIVIAGTVVLGMGLYLYAQYLKGQQDQKETQDITKCGS